MAAIQGSKGKGKGKGKFGKGWQPTWPTQWPAKGGDKGDPKGGKGKDGGKGAVGQFQTATAAAHGDTESPNAASSTEKWQQRARVEEAP